MPSRKKQKIKNKKILTVTGGIKKPKRPSPEERRMRRLANTHIQSVDKKYRTRKGKAVEALLFEMEEGNPGAIQKLRNEVAKAKPPKSAPGMKIYSGKGRTFEKDFGDDFWAKQKKPWTCAKCGEEIDPKGTHGLAKSIDHKTPWATVKTSIDTAIVCCNGVHWEVVWVKDMRKAYQDSGNLQPMHKGCNSGKNGPKTSDSIAPQPRGNCPGPSICKETKART